jgi:hypothetical protein
MGRRVTPTYLIIDAIGQKYNARPTTTTTTHFFAYPTQETENEINKPARYLRLFFPDN